MSPFAGALILALLALGTASLMAMIYPRVAVRMMFAALLCFGAMLVLAVRNGQ